MKKVNKLKNMECTFGFVFAVKKSQLVVFRCFEELYESDYFSITVCFAVVESSVH